MRWNEMIEIIIVLIEGILLPIEILFVLIFNKKSTIFYSIEENSISNYPNLKNYSIKNDLIIEPTIVFPILKKKLKWEEKYFNELNIKIKNMWNEPSCNNIKIRGKTYMNDHIKINNNNSIGKLIHVDIWKGTIEIPQRIDHIALMEKKRSNSIIHYFQQEYPQDIIFILNFQIPGNPFLHVVCYWILPLNELKSSLPFYTLWNEFINSIDTNPSYCNKKLKLIPIIIDGPWLVKATVPQKPTLIGNKLKQRYYRGLNYIEIDIDIESNTIASNIVNLCRGYSKQLIIDLHLTLQGDKNNIELPEKIFGSVRFNQMDFNEGQDIMKWN